MKIIKTQKYFGDVELNPELKATTDIQCIKGADIVLLAVPTIAIDQFVTKSMIY